MNYEQQAEQFAKKHNVKMNINFCRYGQHFNDETAERYIFNITIKRNRKQFTINFGQSISDQDKKPTIYDILSCLQKYENATFEEFCSNYGYNNDSIKALKIYKAVSREYKNVFRLFSDIMEELQEIQ
jgi:hypothetical protein